MSICWTHVCYLDVAVKGKLPLHEIPNKPGLYRLIVDRQCYVGQAKNVRHRVYEYCRPTQHLEHEHRLHWLLRGKSCQVEVFVPPEMESLALRRSQEAAAFAESREQGFQLWNLSQYQKATQYRMLIEYHEIMIDKYKNFLAASISN